MISSALIEPLVKPLVGSRRSGSGTRSSHLSGSKLAMTALAVSALAAVAGADAPEAHAAEAKAEVTQVRRVAHKKPALTNAIPRFEPTLAILRKESFELEAPRQAPDFESNALRERHYLHEKEPGIFQGPGLSRGRRLDRLLASADLAFLNFGSAKVLAAQPHS